jgi:ankyrin repeat protein
VILEACGNLLEEASGAIRPIHYTVQEFFTPAVRGMPQHPMRTQLLDSESVHKQLSSACLQYIHLVAFNRPAWTDFTLYERLRDNSLAGYACQSFDYHVSNCDQIPFNVVHQLERLFQHDSAYLAAILQIKILPDDYKLIDIRQRFNDMNFLVTPSTIVYSTSLYNIPTLSQQWIDQTPPIYALHLAASVGLTGAVIRLLKGGCEFDEKDRSGSTPLYYASLNGHLEILRSLLNEDADVNAQGGQYGYVLQAASAGGHEQVVKTLLDKGAEVNAQGGHYGNALQSASLRGHEQVVKTLLDEGAEVNAQGGYYGNALQAASLGGHEQVVKTLLNKGAEVNTQGGGYGNALQAASLGGHEQVVKTLLDKGAEVNAQGGAFGNALQAASFRGHEQIVKRLLDKGAEVNAQGGEYGNALQAVSFTGHEQVVKMLLDAGAHQH